MPGAHRLYEQTLGDILCEQGVINAEQLAQALETQKTEGRMLGEIIVELKFAQEEEIAQALTLQFGFPFLPLDNYDLNEEAVRMIPRDVARHYYLIGIDRIGDTLTIAMANPLNEQAIRDIEELTGTKIQSFVSTISSIKHAIERYYK